MLFRRLWIPRVTLFLLATVTMMAQGRNDALATNPLRGINTRFPRFSAGPGFIVIGSVTLVNGAVPRRLVQLERVCGGRTEGVAYANSKGQYYFNLGILYDPRKPTVGVKHADSFAGCTIHANLEGYRAQSVELVPAIKSEKRTVAEIFLQPAGKSEGAIVSATNARIVEKARNDYDRGLDLAANTRWHDAIAAMKTATSQDANFATAWVSLGKLQILQNDNKDALRSYSQAIAADDRFAEAYIDLAVIETAAAHWDKVVENTDKAIALDPDAFPRAYYLNTMANIKLNKAAAALKSVAEGIRADQDHRFPELQYMRGMLLISQGDKTGARTQLESYLALSPRGDNAENASRQLKSLPEPK
jgi:tetratricopeptide (TPR) repeat protein